jgi:hypothetical protein
VGKSKIYWKCIEEMLKISDNVIVICPDAFKNMKQSFNKIKYYSHKGIVWDGVAADVSIFELDNNHNSKLTTDGINMQIAIDKKEAIKTAINNKFNLNNGGWRQYVKSEETGGFVVPPNCLSFNILQNYTDNTYIKYEGELQNTHSYIVENYGYLADFLKTKVGKFLQKYPRYYSVPHSFRIVDFPLPDLNDKNIGDDNYLYKLYNLTSDEIKCIENKDFDKFVELLKEGV